MLLIHGGWHGAWCWHKLIPLLEDSGHTVIAPDLPGHKVTDKLDSPVLFKNYVAFVKNLVEQQPEQVVLIGHSMAGAIISRVAELIPDQLERLIYISAYLLDDGQCMLEVTKQDVDGLVLPNLEYSENRKIAKIRESMLVDVFYHDCDDQDITLARANVVSQSLPPLATPLHISKENWGSVPRYYIECTLDKAISITTQRRMVAKHPCESVQSMYTGHSPFFSAPVELAGKINQIISV